MDCTEEQRIKYTAYKFSREARRWWYGKRNSLVMELGSKEDITWTQFKEEFYREYLWSLRRSTPRELHSKKEKSCWCQWCGRLHFGNADQGRICAMDVARWETSFETVTRSKGWYRSTWKEMMVGQGINVTTRVVKACGFTLFCSSGLSY